VGGKGNNITIMQKSGAIQHAEFAVGNGSAPSPNRSDVSMNCS
jgi:hypothetical protein